MAQGLPNLTLRRLLFALGALIVAINILSAIWDLRNSRAVVERDALRGYNNLTGLLSDQSARSIESISLIVQETAEEVGRSAHPDPAAWNDRLHDRVSGFPRIRALVVLDAEGHQILSSDGPADRDADFSGRSYFTAQRATNAGTHLSEPFFGTRSHRWSFAVSRRVVDRSGAFKGVVAAIIDIELWERLVRSIDMGGSGFVALLYRNGVLVTRVPSKAEDYGKPLQDSQGVIDTIVRTGHYSGWSPGFFKDNRLLVSATPVPASPLIVMAGASDVNVLAPWREEAWRVTLRTLATSALMGVLVWLAARELTRREEAERAGRVEQERLQLRLRQAEKMEAVGRLAGGIAHDFNNILGGISGYSEMLLEDLPEGSPQQRYASKLLVAARRARDLVEQILTYSRSHRVARRPVDLGRSVRETLDVVRGSLPHGVVLESEIPSSPLVTLGDSTQLHQVVMNLCTNAIHAMGDTGKLSIALEPFELAQPLLVQQGMIEAGHYLRLSVRDTGAGMDEATLARIFEPFFTTKEAGRGTGLGLAMVYGIVADSGGGISVASRPGKGTAFEVYLPRVDTAPTGDAPQLRTDLRRGDGERVLLVDDEIPLLAMMSELLRRLGYEPEPFADPRAALAAFEAQPDAYDVVLTDEAMPELCGSALTSAVRTLRPDIPVIIVTGHAEDGFMETASKCGASEVLLKPVAQRDLAEALACHLAQAALR